VGQDGPAASLKFVSQICFQGHCESRPDDLTGGSGEHRSFLAPFLGALSPPPLLPKRVFPAKAFPTRLYILTKRTLKFWSISFCRPFARQAPPRRGRLDWDCCSWFRPGRR